MGWLFSYDRSFGRKALIAERQSSYRAEPKYTLVKSIPTGNQLWSLLRHKETSRTVIVLDLMQGGSKDEDEGWGYKTMSEDSGPYHYNCPMSILKAADPPTSKYSAEWREKVLQHHAAKKARQVFTTGMVIEYQGERYILRTQASARRGWFVTCERTGTHYRLTAKQIANSKEVK